MALRDISIFVHDVIRLSRVVLGTSTIFSAMLICPAVVVPLTISARVMKYVAMAVTIRLRTIPSYR